MGKGEMKLGRTIKDELHEDTKLKPRSARSAHIPSEIMLFMGGPLTQFCLYPIQRTARGANRGGIEEEDFDESVLPLALVEGACVEDVSPRLVEDEFEFLRGHFSDDSVKQLKRVKYAIVHRAPDIQVDRQGKYVLRDELLRRSENIVAEMAALLRLLRPTSQRTQMVSGEIRGDGTFSTRHLNDPLTFVDAPENQKHFTVRTSDIKRLQTYGPLFRQAMHGPNWKFRMAVHMHEAGHFQNTEWKARYFLWSAALESLFTSKGASWREHSGSMVACERIKDLLGPATQIYSDSELSPELPALHISIEDLIGEVYCLRNHIAHGDKVPDYYFTTPGRDDFDGPLPRFAVLVEAMSFLVRRSILMIMQNGLVSHFQDDASSEAYFSSRGLIRSALQRKGITSFACPE
jgi:hypothetical protein